MIWRKPFVTFLVFAILVGLYVGDRWLVERRREAKELSERTFPFKKDDVAEFTLVTPDEIITVKRQKGDRWQMTQPLKTAADKDTIEVILGNLLPALRYGEFKIDETIKLEDYGLDAPKYKFKVRTKDGRELTLLVGSQAAQSGKFYAKIESENKIFSISEYVKDKLNKKPFDLRDRTVLHVNVDDVKTFELARAVKLPIEIKSTSGEGTTRTATGFQRTPEKIVVTKTDEGDWLIEQPVKWKGDDIEIENLLRKVKNEKVTEFIDEPTTGETYGFDDPQIELRVEQIVKAEQEGTTPTTKTEILTLVVGDRETSPGKGYYAKRADGSIVVIKRDLFDALTVKATKLRNRDLFTLASSDVAYFEIKAGKSKVAVKKNEDGKWVFADDASTSVDQEIVEDKIVALVNLRAKDFEADEPKDLGQYKLDKPYVSLVVADKDRKKVEGIDMGDLTSRENESVVFARCHGSSCVVLLDFTKPSEFFLTKDDLIDKSLFQFDEAEVARAEVFKGPATTFTLLREDDVWRIQKADLEKPRRVSTFWAEDVVRGVRELKYKDVYKGNLTEKEMGLTSPTLEVVLFTKDGKEIARVTRGIEKGERYYTKIRPDGPVYGVETSRFRTLESAIENLLKE